MGYLKSLSFLFRKEYSCCRLNFIIATLVLVFFCHNISTADPPSSDFYCDFQVIGYYPDYWWTPIPDIRYDKLTQVVFCSIYPNSDGSLNTSQIDLTRQVTFVNSAHTNEVDASICIGGWDLSDNFSLVAANSVMRAAFINNLTQYCLTYNFDGVVLDWEPVTDPTDKANYTVLIQELKTTLVALELSLGVAVGALGSEFHPSAIDFVDRLHIMAYDMTNEIHSTYDDAVAAVKHWEGFGFPKSKIILGLPFYGRKANWWYEPSYEPYDEIIAQYHPGPEVDEIDGIYFNGNNTIKAKTQYMFENDYGGVMFWEITEDTGDETSLLTAISDEIHFRLPPDFNCDRVVDAIDLEHLAAHWLMSDCKNINAWCNALDLDQSNTVALQDFALFVQHWMDN
jgi:GH18 family chitinase